MYYLIRVDENNLIKIISNCENEHHKDVVLLNYCNNNNITIVNTRDDINLMCKGNEEFTYCLYKNKYLILLCRKHNASLLFKEYVEKKNNGYLEFIYYNKLQGLPLADIIKQHNCIKNN